MRMYTSIHERMHECIYTCSPVSARLRACMHRYGYKLIFLHGMEMSRLHDISKRGAGKGPKEADGFVWIGLRLGSQGLERSNGANPASH